jgi:hypothetical protein
VAGFVTFHPAWRVGCAVDASPLQVCTVVPRLLFTGGGTTCLCTQHLSTCCCGTFPFGVTGILFIASKRRTCGMDLCEDGSGLRTFLWDGFV